MQLRQGETIVASIRRHWVTMVTPVIVVVVVLSGLIASSLYVSFDFYGYASEIYSIILLALVVYFLYKIYLWRQNLLVITNFRLVNNQQTGIFDIAVTELLYADISDVSFTQDGALAAAYNYGTLIIRLPSRDQVKMTMVPKPSAVMEIINQVRMAGPPNQPQPQSTLPPTQTPPAESPGQQ